MSLETLPFSSIPHTTDLFLHYLTDFEAVERFFARPPATLDWVADEATRVRYDPLRRELVADVLERQNQRWGAGEKTRENLRRFRAGALVAVTGQQVGLFGGPLFAIFKAITAVRVAQEATQKGIDTVPVFWLATEDHDFDEVNAAILPDREGTLHSFATTAAHATGAPVAEARLGDDIQRALNELRELLPDSEAFDQLRASYRPGQSFGDAFASLFAWLFQEFGVILIDNSDPELHRIVAPIYLAAAERSKKIDAGLLERGRQLREAGYHEQVKVTPESTLLFGLHEGARTPIHHANGTYQLGAEQLTAEELTHRIELAPQQFSANVLLRPVVQDFLLPTLTYVGGPAEVAYFSQVAVVYDELIGRVTPILPRFSATLVEPQVKKFLDRYSLRLVDLFCGVEDLRTMVAERALPPDLKAALRQGEQAVEEALMSVRESLAQLDPTLVAAAEKSAAKVRYQLTRLERKAAAAEIRRTSDIARHVTKVTGWLYPHRELQERLVMGLYFVARNGRELLHTLADAAGQGGSAHHVLIYL